MKILYIPFTLEDALFDLYLKAQKWQKQYVLNNKEAAIMTHKEAHKQLTEPSIRDALQTGKAKIYILSHGIGSQELKVANQSIEDESYQELTIAEVAQRFQHDFLNQSFSTQNIVKLYFCDEDRLGKKPEKMATVFRKQLGNSYQSLDVHYYTDVKLSIPINQEEQGLFSSEKQARRRIQLASDLVYFDLLIAVGKPQNFRQSLNTPRNPFGFYNGTNLPDQEINETLNLENPFTHALVKALSNVIQADKVLCRQHDKIIKELIPLLPASPAFYYVDSLTLTGAHFRLELRINKEKLKEFFIQHQLINAHDLAFLDSEDNAVKPAITPPQSNPWIDPEDLLGTFSIVQEPIDFLPLDDYDTLNEHPSAVTIKLNKS